jgi:hypothetical protein
MSVAEIFEQARALSPQERKELTKLLIDTLETGVPASRAKTSTWIAAMLQAMDPIELVDWHIEDPVEWVEAQRQKRREQLKPYLGEDE